MSSVVPQEKITMNEARRQGLTTYFSGNICKNGHIARRSVFNASCSVCMFIKRKKLYQERVLLVAKGMPKINDNMRRKAKRDQYVGKRFYLKHPMLGMISGIVTRSEEHHIWIRDHGQPRLESVVMVPKRWIVEGVNFEYSHR